MLLIGFQNVSALSTFVYTMLKHPEVQKKAQEELDRVIKPGNLPTLKDEEFLPYTTAIMKEVLRWKTVGPIGQFLYRFPSAHIYVPMQVYPIVHRWRIATKVTESQQDQLLLAMHGWFAFLWDI